MDTGDRVGMGSSHPPPTLGNRYHSAPHPAPLDDEDGGQGDEANQMGKKGASPVGGRGGDFENVAVRRKMNMRPLG